MRRQSQYTEDNYKSRLREVTSTVKELEASGSNLTAEVKRLTKANADLAEENRHLCAKARDQQRSAANERDQSLQHFQVQYRKNAQLSKLSLCYNHPNSSKQRLSD